MNIVRRKIKYCEGYNSVYFIDSLEKIDDNLLHTSFQYYCIPVLYIVGFLSLKYYSNPWPGLWILYALMPILDELLVEDDKNPNPEET